MHVLLQPVNTARCKEKLRHNTVSSINKSLQRFDKFACRLRRRKFSQLS
jgi:hypothetical protein